MDHLREMTILVVDDSDDNLQLIKTMLKSEGFQNIVTAIEGHDAIQHMKSKKIDTILLDIEMPDIKGTDVCKFIKSDLRNQFIPVIFVSGTYEEDTVNNCFELGGFDFIRKPFTKAELLIKVKACLSLKYANDRLKNKVNVLSDKIQSIVSMGRSASDISNDFRSVLSAITGFCELLRKSLAKESKSWKYNESVFEATKRGIELSQKLSIFAETTKELAKLEDMLKNG